MPAGIPPENILLTAHIGSGTDPVVWQQVAEISIADLVRFADAHTLNLGGGFKVGRMPEEKTVDLQKIGLHVREVFLNFAEKTGRKIHLEIEPGTFLMANAGCILAQIDSVVSTGRDGYVFYKLNTGMTELIRPSMYGAQHSITVLTKGNKDELIDAIVVGHCCESGDLFTQQPGDPEGLLARRLPRAVPGDFVIIGGAGAYGAGFSAVNYNSFPEAAQVMLCEDGRVTEIRRSQLLTQIIQNEID
jgi:diaminopimelate decarboxylase